MFWLYARDKIRLKTNSLFVLNLSKNELLYAHLFVFAKNPSDARPIA